MLGFVGKDGIVGFEAVFTERSCVAVAEFQLGCRAVNGLWSTEWLPLTHGLGCLERDRLVE